MVPPIVRVTEGWLRGTRKRSQVGGFFMSFEGIPYAKPPVGDLRFKDPEPPELWTDVRPAVEEGAECTQWDDHFNTVKGEEDCLYLNVATTSLEGKQPVMVWIHGGGFIWGSGTFNLYGPDLLINNGVVMVTLNYRLGVLGFLSLGHEALPGNFGLKDQVAALRWIKKNISQFGGDPNNVTIFGESAGSVSVHYLLLSPLSKGLFHKAIAQSGVSLNPWANVPDAVESSHCLAKYLGNKSSDPHEIVKYLRTKSARDLCEASRNMPIPEGRTSRGILFGPVVDSKSTKPFLPRPAHELIAEGHDVPLIVGHNSHEGNIVFMEFTDEMIDDLGQHFDPVVSQGLQSLPAARKQEAIDKIKRNYFGDREVSTDTMNEYVQCMGDLFFVIGIHEAVDKRVNIKSPTYLYRFTHNAPEKLSKILWKVEVQGAGHFDEIVYIFKPSLFPGIPFVPPGSTEEVISERFVRMWTDFAKTGNPTPTIDNLITTRWERVTRTAKNYLAIDAQLTAGVNPSHEACQFWKRILEN